MGSLKNLFKGRKALVEDETHVSPTSTPTPVLMEATTETNLGESEAPLMRRKLCVNKGALPLIFELRIKMTDLSLLSWSEKRDMGKNQSQEGPFAKKYKSSRPS